MSYAEVEALPVRVMLNLLGEAREEDAERMDKVRTTAKSTKGVGLVLTLPAMI